MDQQVKLTQEWLNATYSSNSNYVVIAEDGQTGGGTFRALVRALQIELNLSVDGIYGNGVKAAVNALNLTPGYSANANIVKIIRGSLWCKGYTGGSMTDEIATYDTTMVNSIKEFQGDAGVTQSGNIDGKLLKALMNTDGYGVLQGEALVQQFQQQFNGRYYNVSAIDLVPTNGIYERNTNKMLIAAVQYEGNLSVDGIFGPNTLNSLPTLSRGNSRTNYNYLLQYFLAANGYNPNGFDGQYGNGAFNAVKEFQSFMMLGADGICGKQTWASLMASCGDNTRSTTGCDCATPLTLAKAQALKNAGYNIVGRYLTNVDGGTLNKRMTAAEIGYLEQAGLKFFPIMQEHGNDISDFNVFSAMTDLIKATTAAVNLGIPAGSTIYFAVDMDATDAQIQSNIIPYFQVLASSNSAYNIGVYGTRNVCRSVQAYTTYSFVSDMSTGWSGNLGFRMPTNWAFDQIREFTFTGSTDGSFALDNDVVSGRDAGVNPSACIPATPPESSDVSDHNMVLGNDGYYTCSDEGCNYRVAGPELEDSIVLQEEDYMRIRALDCALLVATDAQMGGAYGSSPAAIPAQGSYYLPEKIMLTKDQIRENSTYKEGKSYSHSDSSGSYVHVYTEATKVLEWEDTSYSLMTVNAKRMNSHVDIAVEEGVIEDLMETLFMMGVSLYVSAPVAFAISTLLNLAEGEKITLNHLVDEAAAEIADKLGIANFGIFQWVFNSLAAATHSELQIGDYVVTITETATQFQSPTSEEFKVYLDSHGCEINMFNETRSWT